MAVAAEVVEPVIHLVGELLANAAQSSAPAINVPVSVRRVQRGAVIEIDDGGICMDEHRLEQAREVVSGRRPVGFGELGEILQTGLAVVGFYVRRPGFRADLSESPYGGVRAVVLIPADVVTTAEPAGVIPAQPPSSPQTETLAVHHAVGPAADAATTDPPLLRRRSRRGQTSSASTQPDGPHPPGPTPQEAGS